MSLIYIERQVYSVLVVHSPKADFILDTHFRDIYY